MRVLEGLWSAIPSLGGRWSVTLGTFDGVHRGHQAILHDAIGEARAHGYDGAVAVTFGQHPRAILSPDRSPRILTSLEEKVLLLRATGLDALVVLGFDDELAHMSYDDFVRDVLIRRLGMAHFVLGHDVHFGRDRRGNYQTVAQLAEAEGFGISQVASIRAGADPISSTRIRECVAHGDLVEAAHLMGHPYAIRGSVVEGRRLGRTLGFPTANVDPQPAGKLLPPVGVYAGWGRVDSDDVWHPAAINVGRAPTVTEDGPVRVEGHLLGAEFDLYGRVLHLALASKIRDEMKFDGKESLVERIRLDVAETPKRLVQAPESSRPGRLDDLIAEA